MSLVLGFFTEEDQELTVEEDLLPARLAAGVQQRRLCAQSTDVALSNILRDERQRISSIALAGYQGGAYRPTEGLTGVIEYPSMRDSYRLTCQPALVLGARVQHAFTWVFVIQEVYSRMVGVQAAGGFGGGLYTQPSLCRYRGTHGGDVGRDGCPPFHEGLCPLLSTAGVE